MTSAAGDKTLPSWVASASVDVEDQELRVQVRCFRWWQHAWKMGPENLDPWLLKGVTYMPFHFNN